MDGYREAGRTRCTSCGRALADDQLEPTGSGGLVCAACRAEVIDRELTARAEDSGRVGRRRRAAFFAFLAALTAVIVGLGIRAYRASAEEDARAAKLADERRRWHTRLDPVLFTLKTWQTAPDRPCADAELAARYPLDGVPWVVVDHVPTADGALQEINSEIARPERFLTAELIVSLRDSTRDRLVVLQEIATGKALCWTQRRPAPDQGFENAMTEGVERISKQIRLAR